LQASTVRLHRRPAPAKQVKRPGVRLD
jgi:hypothetical protein